MSNHKFHINQISYINPLFTALRESGINIEHHKQKSGLRYFDLQNVDAYVPVEPLEGFLEQLFSSQGLSHLDKSLIEYFELEDMGEFGSYLVSLPNALAAIDESIKLEPLISSNCKTKILINGRHSFYTWSFINPPTRGRMISEEFCFHMVLSGLKNVIGAKFRIASIQIPRSMYPSLKHTLPDGLYEFKLSENTYSIGFLTRNLSEKVDSGTESTSRPEVPSDSVRVRLSNLLAGLEEGIVPSEVKMSNILEMSSRNMRRHLSSEGTSYRELLREYMLTKAIRQLETTQRSVTEISEALGYKETTNFVRAFKSWTGTTPLQYRFNN